MIYLIGGAPRVGKTTLARMLLSRMGVPFLPMDVLASAISDTVPSADIRFGEHETWDKIPEKFFPYFEKVVNGLVYHAPEYTVEGDSFFPAQARAIMEKTEAKACFLGVSEISLDDIKKYAFHDWVGEMPQEKQDALPTWIIKQSVMIKEECAKYDIPYFDMSIEREATLETAYEFLVTL